MIFTCPPRTTSQKHIRHLCHVLDSLTSSDNEANSENGLNYTPLRAYWALKDRQLVQLTVTLEHLVMDIHSIGHYSHRYLGFVGGMIAVDRI